MVWVPTRDLAVWLGAPPFLDTFPGNLSGKPFLGNLSGKPIWDLYSGFLLEIWLYGVGSYQRSGCMVWVPTRDLAVWLGVAPFLETFLGSLSGKPFWEAFPGNLSGEPFRETFPGHLSGHTLP
jgi:hypothetical protein